MGVKNGLPLLVLLLLVDGVPVTVEEGLSCA